MSSVLILNEKDIRPLISMKETIELVEEAFKEKEFGRVQMPSKTYVFFKKYEGDFRLMPAYLEKNDIAGVKIVNVHQNNPLKYSLPTVMATIVLLDPRNGFPISIMAGSWITAIRTGSAGGVAAKYLARKDSRTVAIVGAGTQARTQLIALREVLPRIEEVLVVDKIKEVREAFAKEVGETLQLTIQPMKNIREAVKNADVIVTVTPSRIPLVMDEWIRNGVHINAIGADAPGKQELDPAILKRAKIVIDEWEQAIHSGEVNVPLSKKIIRKEDIYAEIGEVITGKKEGRSSYNEITVFDSTGLAVQDITTAWRVFKKAKKAGSGVWVNFL